MLRSFHRVLLAAVVVSLLAACSGRPAALPTATPTPPQAVQRPTAALTPSPEPSATSLPYPPALRVGSGVLYQPEIETGLRQIEAALPYSNLKLTPDEQRVLVLQDLVDQELLAQAAFENGFTLSESEVRAVYEALDQAAPGGMANWLAVNGYAQDLFFVTLRRAIAAAWMRDRITAAVPAEAEQVRARQVILSTLDQARQVIAEARQPDADFTAIAYRYDPYTGGDLGWFARGTLFFPQVEAAAFALPFDPDQPPAFSEPVESPLGFHVLQVIGRASRPLSASARLTLQRQALYGWLAERYAALAVELPPAAPALPFQAVDAAPVYAVQSGENYYSIAQRLRVPVQALMDANPAFPPEALAAGSELTLPGVRGAEGRVLALDRPPGVDALAWARAYGLDPLLLARLNRLTALIQLYEGAALLWPEAAYAQAVSHPIAAAPLASGELLIAAAVQSGESPWALALASGSLAPGRLMPGEPLFLPPAAGRDPRPFPINLADQKLVQGGTLVIRVNLPAESAPPTGALDGYPLHFFPTADGWVALQGLPAMGQTGLALLELRAANLGGFEVSLPFYPGDFPQDPPLTVDPATIDPAVTAPEEAQVAEITAPATPTKYWDGPFVPPVDSPGCFRSLFGNRRSFNGSPYRYFHAGLDYGVCGSPNVFAPAPGKVVFAGPLDVRGNATIIDHGWGVYSGFWHQSAIQVQVGETVQTGQVIGIIGATGRITGEHLHWEVFVGGVQVDPLDWLETSFP
mgnify:CR=1 FL=1